MLNFSSRVKAHYTLLNGVDLFYFIALWAGIIFVLQWFFAYDQLVAVTQTAPSLLPRFILEGYLAFFKNMNDFIPITITLIAFFQSLTIVILIEYGAITSSKTQKVSFLSALIGSGCIACGASILSPIFSTYTATAAALTGHMISQLLLVLALVLAIISWWQASSRLPLTQKDSPK